MASGSCVLHPPAIHYPLLLFSLLLIVVWFPVMGNIIPFKILFLIFPAVEVIPDLRPGSCTQPLFALLRILTACRFHITGFSIPLKR